MYHELHEAYDDETRSSRVTLLSGHSQSGIILDDANEGDWPIL